MSRIWNSTLQIQVLEDTEMKKVKRDRTENANLSFKHGHLEHCAKDSEPMFGFNRIEFGNQLVMSTKGGRETGRQVYSPQELEFDSPGRA